MEGVQNNDIGIVDRILQYDAVSLKNFNVNGPSQDSLLHVAVRNRNYEICKMLIKFGADVNLLNLYGQSPLHVAEANFDFRMCKCLMRTREEKRTRYKNPLHIYAKRNNFGMLKAHLYQNRNVNETDEKMRTPLHVAIIFASDSICDLLLKYGSDIYAEDRNMDNPIQLAFYYDRLELRERMLSNLSYIG